MGYAKKILPAGGRKPGRLLWVDKDPLFGFLPITHWVLKSLPESFNFPATPTLYLSNGLLTIGLSRN